jgi:hypothetical protein
VTGDPARTAQQDQLDAASAEAIRLAGTIAALIAADIYTTSDAINARIEAWKRTPPAEWRGCRHLPSSPAVVFGLIHRPGEIVCADCALPMLILDARARPDTCDVCEQRSHKFREIAIPLGPIMLGGNACPACVSWLP